MLRLEMALIGQEPNAVLEVVTITMDFLDFLVRSEGQSL